MKNVFTIDADIKLKMQINEPTVVQNDNIRFIINVFDGGQPLSLDSATTVSLASVRLDRRTVVTLGTKIGTNTVQFDLGTEETKFPGRVKATAQFYDSEGRVSTISFSYRVAKDPTGDGYIPTEREQTLIEVVLNDGPLIIQQAQDAANFANEQGQFAQTQANAASEAAANATNAANNANVAADNANLAAERANSDADYARLQGDYAKEQGDAANLATNNANDAANNANNAATNADNAADNANAAADNANTAASNANTKATYAQQQGDYAKAQAELIDTILEQGVVTTINGKSGNVILTAEDVNAIPISEKGAAGGVARLNEFGKVVDANGMEVEGKVKTVNGIGPDENGNIKIETATSWNDLSDKPNSFPSTIPEVDGLQVVLNEKANNTDLTSLEQTVTSHLADDVTQQEGVHGLRVQNGQIEYWDKDDEEWKRIAGGAEVPLGNVKNFQAKAGNGQVTLTWEDPEDVIVNDVVVSKWAGTKILRKVGSWPENENDGVLVVNNGIRNQYAEDGFVDSGLENDVTYYYMAFPYNTQGLYTVSEENRVSATPREAKIYGLEWNQTLDTYQRLDDAVEMVAVTQGQNDFSNVYPWSEMKRCNLDDNANVLAYFGDPTYKDDGSNGQVMVQIPKFWYKSEMVNESGQKKYRWWIADNELEGFKLHPAFVRNGVEKDFIYIGAYEGYESGGKLHSIAGVMPTGNKTIVQFRGLAQARGSKWFQQDFLTTCAIELLYLIEYAHFDSQTKIGRGITNDSSYHQTGKTAQYGNESYGTTSNDTTTMSYRGIENLYGNYWKWVDGININNHRTYIADHNFESDKFDGHYRQVGFTNATSNGYVKDIGWTSQDNFMFLAIAIGGSDSSYLHDYYYQNTGARVARFGGYRAHGSFAGAFYWSFSSASPDSDANVGARLLCVP